MTQIQYKGNVASAFMHYIHALCMFHFNMQCHQFTFTLYDHIIHHCNTRRMSVSKV